MNTNILERIIHSYDVMKKNPDSQASGAWIEINKSKKNYITALETGNIKSLSVLLQDFLYNECTKELINYKRNGKISHAQHRHQAKNINKLMKNKGDTILEIGGGFGAMISLLFNKFNFKGIYIDVDLPETLCLAYYNLSTIFPDKHIYLYDGKMFNYCDYDIVFLPNYFINSIPSYFADIVVNFNSLSEMSCKDVYNYIDNIMRICKYYFYHCNSNESVFSYNHLEVSADDFPIDANCFDLISKKKSRYISRYVEYVYKRLCTQIILGD